MQREVHTTNHEGRNIHLSGEYVKEPDQSLLGCQLPIQILDLVLHRPTSSSALTTELEGELVIEVLQPVHSREK